MRRRARGYSLHPALVVLPVGAYAIAFGAFVVAALTDDPAWRGLALGTTSIGCGTALLAAVPGLRDLASRIVRRGSVRGAIGGAHTAAALAALVVFAWNLSHAVRVVAPEAALAATVAGAGLVVMLFAARLGWAVIARAESVRLGVLASRARGAAIVGAVVTPSSA